MPKVHVVVGPLFYSVFDQRRKLDKATCKVLRRGDSVQVSIPLSALSWPEKVLTNSWTRSGDIPMDQGRWVTLVLEGETAEAARQPSPATSPAQPAKAKEAAPAGAR